MTLGKRTKAKEWLFPPTSHSPAFILLPTQASTLSTKLPLRLAPQPAIGPLAPNETRELFASLQRQYPLQVAAAQNDATDDPADIEAECDAEIDKRVKEVKDGTARLLCAEESESRTNAVFAKLGIQRPIYKP